MSSTQESNVSMITSLASFKDVKRATLQDELSTKSFNIENNLLSIGKFYCTKVLNKPLAEKIKDYLNENKLIQNFVEENHFSILLEFEYNQQNYKLYFIRNIDNKIMY